jgi:hypothetical protein
MSGTDILNVRCHRVFSNGQWVELDLHENRYKFVDSKTNNEVSRASAPLCLRDVLQVDFPIVPKLTSVARFAWSSSCAARIRTRSIRDQLMYCRTRSMRWQGRPSLTLPIIERHVRVYKYLRALRLRQPLCLEDSVSGYLYFSSIFGMRVEMVFGVETLPKFRAHAWLEMDGILLNDTRRRVEYYSEILRMVPKS